MKHYEFFVSNLIQTASQSMLLHIHSVMHSVKPLRGAVEEFCVFQLFLASLPNV